MNVIFPIHRDRLCYKILLKKKKKKKGRENETKYLHIRNKKYIKIYKKYMSL